MNADERKPEQPAGRSGALSASQSAELASFLADLSRAGMPLSAGLRALADELPRRGLASRMRLLAERLDLGEPLETAVADPSIGLPNTFRGLVVAAARSGRLPEVLSEYIQQQRATSQLRQSLAAALAYPITLLVLLGMWLIFVLHFVIPPLADIMADGSKFGDIFFYSGMRQRENFLFGSLDVRYLRWLSDYGPLVIYALLGGALLVAMAAALGVQRAGLNAAIRSMPLIGPVWRSCALAECSDLMALLIEQGIPGPTALRLAGDSLYDTALAHDCHAAAARSGQGMALAEATRLPGFPPTMRSMVAWGERSGTLEKSLRAAAEMFRDRARLYGELMRSVLPPVVFLVIAAVSVTALVVVGAPLIRLLFYLT